MLAVVCDRSLVIGGHEFVAAVLPGAFEPALGTPSRVLPAGDPAPHGHRSNQRHIYDEIGISLTEDHFTFTVSAVEFFLSAGTHDDDPRSVFSGVMQLGSTELRAGAMEDDLRLSGLALEEWLSGLWRDRSGPVEVDVHAEGDRLPSGRRSRSRRILTVSVSLVHDPRDTTHRPQATSSE